MSNREFFLERWQAEYPLTVKVFRALPADQLHYRPHPRSRSAGELVALLAYCEQTGIELCEKGEIRWNEPKGFGKLEELIAAHERHHEILSERLRKLDDTAWNRKAKFLVGGQVILEGTVEEFFWIALADVIHHRGQLTVYIRPMGGKVPSIYGLSADDPGT